MRVLLLIAALLFCTSVVSAAPPTDPEVIWLNGDQFYLENNFYERAPDGTFRLVKPSPIPITPTTCDCCKPECKCYPPSYKQKECTCNPCRCNQTDLIDGVPFINSGGAIYTLRTDGIYRKLGVPCSDSALYYKPTTPTITTTDGMTYYRGADGVYRTDVPPPLTLPPALPPAGGGCPNGRCPNK